MATNTNYTAFPHGMIVPYKKFDFCYEQGGTYRFYYATQDNIGQSPLSVFDFPIYSYSRKDDAATVYFHHTGSDAPIAVGSIIRVAGLSDSSFNYTGMVFAVGSGWASYMNPGYPGTYTESKTLNCPNPAWTTGFMFLPAYSTSLGGTQNMIVSKFADGYSQRQRAGLNSNTHTYRLVFDKRSDNEAKAIFNFVEDHGGVDAISLLMPVTKLTNNPSLKFVLRDPNLTTVFYNINDITLTADQVYEF